jgi:hypothetical protein
VPHARPQRETQRPAMSQLKLAGYRDASNTTAATALGRSRFDFRSSRTLGDVDSERPTYYLAGHSLPQLYPVSDAMANMAPKASRPR